MGSDVNVSILWPQIGLSIFAYPLVSRLVVGLDRWRLMR
jgi:hypothetical protein